MKVAKNAVVSIHYTLTAPDGQVLDSSSAGEPLAYVHGLGNLIPGLEARLEGHGKSEPFDVTLAAVDGYGERDERLVQKIERNQLPPSIELELGLELQARGPQGDMVVSVVAIEGQTVTLDGNHPLAGMELHFVGEIVDVRSASGEELAHGHVHGAGGHHH
ncbi:MAG: peptidylprolyl isomerase [Planctomycetes bacterium]|nr:peptidylprolyl isomerase [Planctomycetota bacterium]